VLIAFTVAAIPNSNRIAYMSVDLDSVPLPEVIGD
jgi:hypothetical protein